MTYQVYKFVWQGIEIKARYTPKDFHKIIAHLEIETINPPKSRLPITETGYKSHFHPIGAIERDYGGDVIACVTDWLNDKANDKNWKRYVEASKQLELF